MKTIKHIVPDGWLKGHVIRKARKPGQCEYWYGRQRGHCKNQIAVGDYYVDGEQNPMKAGGFGYDRYCLNCVPEALDYITQVCETRATPALRESGVASSKRREI